MAKYLTPREALSLPAEDVEFVAQKRMKYGSKSYDEKDVVPLQSRDKAALVGVKLVKPRMTEAAVERAKAKKAKDRKATKPVQDTTVKSVEGDKNKSMDGKGKAK